VNLVILLLIEINPINKRVVNNLNQVNSSSRDYLNKNKYLAYRKAKEKIFLDGIRHYNMGKYFS
jgi:hypothetical protein